MSERVTPCSNPLHNHPFLPTGYVAASDEATDRLQEGWDNRQCPDCHLYGWEPPRAAEVVGDA